MKRKLLIAIGILWLLPLSRSPIWFGVAHGDLNPNNIIVTPDGTIKLVDPVGYGDEVMADPAKFIEYD